MRRIILTLCMAFAAISASAQVKHTGRHDERLLVGQQQWFNEAGQKIAEVDFSEKGDLLGFKTWDEKGLLIDDERADSKRKRSELPENLELTFLDNGIGFLIIDGREDNAPHAVKGERVAVHYELMLQDLTQIEETYSKKKPFKFKFGEGEVIPGFDEAVGMLKVGQEGYFYIPAELGYGGQVVGSIPPFSALLYRIKFVDLN